MSRFDALVDVVTTHTRVVVAVMLVVTLVLGTGAGMVEQSSSLDQFQSDSPESEKLDYIQQNFSTGRENVTTVQLIARDDNVLDKGSLVGLLELERELRANETIDRTLVENDSIVGIPNVVATTAIRQERGAKLEQTATEFERLNASVSEERAALEERSATLNATARDLQTALATLERDPNASVEAQFETVRANTSVELDEEDYRTFEQAAAGVRNAEDDSEREQAYTLGTQGVLQDEYAALQERSEALQADAERLAELGEDLRAANEAFQNASAPTLDEQLEQLRSMNESEIDEVLTLLLSDDGREGGTAQSSRVFAFLPTDYEPGSTEATATMLVVTQESDGETNQASGQTSRGITDSQLAMQELATGETEGVDEVMVFGSGIISQEITQSMTDSLLVVGPLALLFVVVALVVAYRDLVDILLGVAGIGIVLVWTFGFMGWTGIAFNQIFVAIPVLLIGLSIDYAIHVFMRHREERESGLAGDAAGTAATGTGRPGTAGVWESMRVALGGVGVALLWVTATTVIGFLSNLTSPVPPIREFGVVSAFGIVSALVVFGALTPALKIEVDSFLEARGRDRSKRAFGTGGGRFPSVLAGGATAARKAPYVVIGLALVLSAGGAYGASQVDTSFEQEDFLADDPPAWMDSLPEPFAPGEYTAKATLDYVNSKFLRQDTQAQILVEGEVTNDDTLEAVASAERDAAERDEVVSVLSNGEADVTSPLSVMRRVAAANESFNETFVAADGDGVPDRNLEGVYDELFAVAPEQAASVVHRADDGDYEAVRVVVSTRGDASGDDVTTAMRDVAAGIETEGEGLTATGQRILFTLVQDQLLETVVQSLLITLLATFVFLMVVYRFTEGSATLGAVTLLPVALSVSWILGTMYLLGIPFNILTGMITSLTVGLGVAYSIHLSERFTQELDRTDDLWESMHRAVTGTGGALLGSAATTVGGFGVLAVAILPPLQQFGVITGLTIVYAFLASVFVLPSLLVVWHRHLGPGGSTARGAKAGATTPGED